MVQICSDFGITEGQTYCDTNNNLFKCVNGSLVYQSSNCGRVISNPDPPVAGMIATPSEGTAPLVVTFKETSTGYVAAWQWDFGDGHYDSTGGAKIHTYTSPGIYTVIYTVGNITGQSSVQKRITVTATQPPSTTCNCNLEYDFFDPCYDYCATPHLPCSIGEETLVDGQTYCDANKNLFKCVNGTLVYQSSGCGITQPPSTTCNCNIELDVFDPCYDYCITHPPIVPPVTPPIPPPTPPPTENPPVANVIANPSEGTAPLVVTFTDKTTGSTTAWFWSFGDSDTNSTGGTKTHTYTSPGSYTATYTVGNSAGNSTWKKVITVTKGVVTTTPKTCTPACGTGYICDTLIGECRKTTAPIVACVPACGTGYSCNEVTKTCVKNSLDGDVVAAPCVGLNRNGSLDPTCIMEKGNENYLYGAIGLVLLLVVMKMTR